MPYKIFCDDKSVASCDRGFLYGDGFFTTALIVKKKILNWQEHWQRLVTSAQRLQFLPLSEKELLDEINGFLKEHPETATVMVLKIIVTRGCGGQGYQPPELDKVKPHIMLQLLPFPAKITSSNLKNSKNYQAWCVSELKVMTCQTTWGYQPLLAGMKHLNRLENVLARQELSQGEGKEFDEGIMLDLEGLVISGTQSNICLIKNQQIITPVLTRSGVQGTLLARLKPWLILQGWEWVERPFDLNYLKQADEVFFCNAVRGVMPMKQLNEQPWSTQQAKEFHFAIMKMLMDEA